MARRNRIRAEPRATAETEPTVAVGAGRTIPSTMPGATTASAPCAPSSPSSPSSRAARDHAPTATIRRHRSGEPPHDVAALPERPPSPSPPARPARPPRRSPPSFPLAVVTGLTNLKATITRRASSQALAADGRLACRAASRSASPRWRRGRVHRRRPDRRSAGGRSEAVALLPPGLVEPATKVLPIAGDGPFGLFGPDLFGDPEARALPYPVSGSAGRRPALEPGWPRTTPRRSGR